MCVEQKYGYNGVVDVVTGYLGRANRGISVSYSSAASDGETPEMQTAVAEHARKEVIGFGDSKF